MLSSSGLAGCYSFKGIMLCGAQKCLGIVIMDTRDTGTELDADSFGAKGLSPLSAS